MKPRNTSSDAQRCLFPELEPCGGVAGRRVSIERLPTNTTTRQHPIHRWFNFIAGFSPEFVHDCLDKAEPSDDACFLDPFAGCATSLLVARQREMPSIGFEPHPFFFRISRAKLPSAATVDELHDVAAVLNAGMRNSYSVSRLPEAPAAFLGKLFDETVLESLLAARESLYRANLADSDLAFLVLSRILDRCSHSQTDGIYKAPTSKKGAMSPLEALE